jgi:hypothetical protein
VPSVWCCYSSSCAAVAAADAASMPRELRFISYCKQVEKGEKCILLLCVLMCGGIGMV